jgi:hypothetical protein
VTTHSPKGSGATVGTYRIGVPAINDKKETKHYPQTQQSQRQRMIHLRLARGRLDGTPRPRSDFDSYEAPSTGRLDRVLTRTRLVQLSANLRLVRPQVGSLDPLYSPTLRQKPEHLMRLPATSYRHGHSYDQRGSSAGVSSHFLLPIPGWEVKTCHYTHLTAHCSTTDHPRGRIRQGLYPTISGIRPYPPVLDPASTQRRSAGRKG